MDLFKNTPKGRRGYVLAIQMGWSSILCFLEILFIQHIFAKDESRIPQFWGMELGVGKVWWIPRSGFVTSISLLSSYEVDATGRKFLTIT